MANKTRSVELSGELVDTLERRANNRDFDSVDEYCEFILESVLYELDPIAEKEDESAIQSRLQSLGYLDQ